MAAFLSRTLLAAGALMFTAEGLLLPDTALAAYSVAAPRGPEQSGSGANRPPSRPPTPRPTARPPSARPPSRPPTARPPSAHRPRPRPPGAHRPGHRPPHFRPIYRPWHHRPYFGAMVAGVTLGTIIAASTMPPLPPDPTICWFWANQAMTRGYWDRC
ncbi:MAG: hypothetical protein EON58_02825 [Alphaproteobacteria bacterium]|nr:MAG: hypothetical protein EON58_02825 [Alphaproteobacteria bacterium]